MTQFNCIYPVWNRREFVALSLRSIDKYLDPEFIRRFVIVDDYSTDGAYELCRDWASGKPWAEVRRAHNPSMATGTPLVETAAAVGSHHWTVLLLSDWYICDDLLAHFAQLLDTQYAALTSYPVTTLSATYRSAADFFGCERTLEEHKVITGGLNAFSPRLLAEALPVLRERPCSVSALFNHRLAEVGVAYRAAWIYPPLAFLHLDEDIQENPAADELYRREAIDQDRILRLVRTYANRGWTRNEVNPITQTVRRAPVKADTDNKRWVHHPGIASDGEYSVAFVTGDGTEATINAARSCRKGADTEVLIINNACSPAHRCRLRRALPWATHIDLAAPTGLCSCWNMAIRRTSTPWIVLSNDDVHFDADWREKMERVLRQNPKALHVNMAYGGSRYGCFAVNRLLIAEIGWFDERYTGILCEDEDWHLRLSEYAGSHVGRAFENEGRRDLPFAITEAVHHDGKYRAADRGNQDVASALSTDANRRFFARKWRQSDDGWWTKGRVDGKYRKMARMLPEIDWYPGAGDARIRTSE